MQEQTLAWLTSTPTTDPNFKYHLERAATEEVRAALERVRGKTGHPARERI